MPTIPCSRCGGAIPLTDHLATAVADLPAGRTIDLFCDDCSASLQHASQTFRTFKVTLHLAEQTDALADIWEDVGGFTLRGGAANLRAFVDVQAAEFSRRMEAIMAMGDAPELDPEPQSEPEPQPEPDADAVPDSVPNPDPDAKQKDIPVEVTPTVPEEREPRATGTWSAAWPRSRPRRAPGSW